MWNVATLDGGVEHKAARKRDCIEWIQWHTGTTERPNKWNELSTCNVTYHLVKDKDLNYFLNR